MNTRGHSVRVRLERLCDASVRVAAVDGGSVALSTAPTPTSRVLVSATDSLAVELEEAQLAVGEGPYVDAVTSVTPVMVPDLARATGSAATRWPFFAREAKALHVAALFAFPIRVSSVSLGTFGLYRRAPGALDTPRLAMALTVADGIAETLMDETTWADLPADESPVAPRPGQLVAHTALFHQAAGMVMIQTDGSIDEAIMLLRGTAFAEGLTLADLAREIIHGRRRFGPAVAS